MVRLAREGSRQTLIHDWNPTCAGNGKAGGAVTVVDETLCVGRQLPQVLAATETTKLSLLIHMAALGIRTVHVGRPVASDQACEAVVSLCTTIRAHALPLDVCCECGPDVRNVERIAALTQRLGLPLEVVLAFDSRSWGRRLRDVEAAVAVAVALGLRVTCLLEDASTTSPSVLGAAATAALAKGASRLCLGDGAGDTTPEGIQGLVEHTTAVVRSARTVAAIDFRGRSRRGLALENALAAIQAGANRVWGSALGSSLLGHNVPMELVLANLALSGQIELPDARALFGYCHGVAAAVGRQIPLNYPLVGRDAFRTATGVHAAAIDKAMRNGDEQLADDIYSSVPATKLGRKQEICIGPMSGASNVTSFLRQRNVTPSGPLVDAILEEAKGTSQILEEAAVAALVAKLAGSTGTIV
jgi:2-isopropylmalate synthase